MTHYTGREKKSDPISPIITSKEIAEQTRKFLLKQGMTIEPIEKGYRSQPFIPPVKRTKEEVRAAWSNNKVHTNKDK